MDLLAQLIRPEILLTIFLIFLLGLRARVYPRASVYVATPPQRVFEVIDVYDGRVFDFGRTKISVASLNAEESIFEFTYSTSMTDGRMRSSTARFELTERVDGKSIKLKRILEAGQPTGNQLLEMQHSILSEGNGSRLKSKYVWGQRALISQILARTDLIGGVYRLKSLAESGVVNNIPYNLLSASVGLLTGLITLLTFAYFTGAELAALSVFAILVHELGHLIAFRMIGQPWGRIMFLPFLGAVAIPRMTFENQKQIAFSALMGPGVSVLLSLACWLPLALGQTPYLAILALGLVTALVNLFNLIPVEPLDGGVALRAILGGLNPKLAKCVLLGIGVLFLALGYVLASPIALIIGALSLAINLGKKPMDQGLKPLSFWEAFTYTAVYAAMLGIHLMVFLDSVPLMRTMLATG